MDCLVFHMNVLILPGCLKPSKTLKRKKTKTKTKTFLIMTVKK